MTGKKEEKPLQETLKKLLEKLDRSKKENDVVRAWEEALGRDIARHTKLVSLKNGKLVANVSDSSRLYELSLKKRHIVAELNKRVNKKIKEIRLKIGEI